MVRVFHGTRWNDEVARAAFQERAEALGRVEHPHLARQIQAGCLEDGRPYVVSEYLDGEDLASHMRRDGPLTPDELALLLLPLCSVLGELRARGIVVQALPPAQVFLVGGPHPVHPEADRPGARRCGPGVRRARGRDRARAVHAGGLPRTCRVAVRRARRVRAGRGGGRVRLAGRGGAGAAGGAATHPAASDQGGGRAASAAAGGRIRAGEAGRRARPVPAGADARRGRDGPGVPGAPREPGAAGGGEGPPGRARPQRSPHPALLPRGAGGEPNQPRPHRGDPRLRRGDGGGPAARASTA